MTTGQFANETAAPAPELPAAVGAVLSDEIAETLASTKNRRDRAAVIAAVVHEIQETVHWLHELRPNGEEEHSLTGLVQAAAQHQQRMTALPPQDDDAPTSPARPRRARARNHRLT